MSNIAQPQTFINYISQRKKCFVTRQNKPVSIKFKIDSSINDSYYFQIINSNNQVVSLSGRSFQIYGSLVDAKGQTHILFYTGNGDVDTTTNVIHFRINTFTQQYLNNIQTNKIADVTIVETTGDTTNVVLRDQGIFYKRAYVGDVPPGTVYDAGFGLKLDGSTFLLTGTVLSGDNSTIEINNNIISCIGGGGSTYTAGEGIGISDQNVISLTATIPLSTSQLTNDSGYITTLSSPDQTINFGKNDSTYYLQVNTDKIAYLSSVPTSTSQLTNDSGFALTSQIPTSASQLDDISAYYKDVTTVSPLIIDTNPFADQSSGKVMKMWIDTDTLKNIFKESYGFATTGMIPTSTSQLTNDSNYATSSYVQSVSGTITGWVDEQDFASEDYVQNRVNISPIYNDTVTHSQNNYILPYNSKMNIYKTKHFAYSDGKVYINALTGGPSNNNAITIEHHIEGFDVGSIAFDGFVIDQNINVIGDLPSTFVAGTTYVFTRRLININNTTTEFISFAYSY